MTRTVPDTKTKILASAYELFYKEGFARVSVDAIADAVGVTKRTLYYHFESKDSLVAAALDYQHQFAFAQIQKWGQKHGDAPTDTPTDLVAEIFENLESWASKPKWLGSGFTRLTMELADRPGHPARNAAHLHKTAVENWLAEELTSLGAQNPTELARQIILLIEGCLSLILIHGDTSYAKSAANAAKHLAINQNSKI
jgi:AcrR family transcriptional regulator